jgi:hypothetical protein
MFILSKKLTFSELRTRAGFDTQTLLANSLTEQGFSITPASISAWEAGLYKPKLFPRNVKILCQVLKCSLDELAEAFSEN